MYRRMGWAAGLAALVLASPARGAATLVVSGSAVFDGRTALRVVAENTGDAAADAVRPEVVFQHRTLTGEPAPLAPAARHEWRFDLPPPPRPSTHPATVTVRYRDPAGVDRSQPYVVLVTTPGAPSSPVTIRIETRPVARVGTAWVRLVNASDTAIAGRLFAVLPGALRTEPESQAGQVPARGEATVPIVLEDGGAEPGARLPLYVVFEHTTDGVHFTALGEGSAEIGVATDGSLPLIVGAASLTAVLLLLVLAARRSRVG
jgi:hypothetical protein